ncbi:putative ion channel protein [Escherichia coli]|uniref:Putative ion channel protein n=1 Tax=Escherichia coli TaxID=562 RepID=A0A376NT15_ECOLX|nr:putative ion channel protein [Escherichia coli]
MLHPRARTMFVIIAPRRGNWDCVQSYSDCGDENRLGITEFALATTAGNSGDSPGFPPLDHRCINANGIAVGLVIRFSQGHAGSDPRL